MGVSCHQGCSLFMDGVMRERKGKTGEIGVKIFAEGRKRVLN